METSPQESNVASSGYAAANPHVLWRQLLGLVIWVGLLSLSAGGPIGALLGLALGATTFADAWVSGIYKRAGTKSFLNISPMAWGIVMILLFIVAYPAYLLNRNKLRTIPGGNGFFIATIVLGGVVPVLLVLVFFLEVMSISVMVMEPGLLFVLFLGVMVVAAIAVGFWSRRVYRKFPVAAGTKWLAGHGRAHAWGVAVFLLLGPVGLLAYFWPVALVLGLVFLALGGRRLALQSQADREIAGVLGLCGTIWLAFAGHEAQLQALIGGANRGVGPFIAIDLTITGSLLYFTSVVGLALGTDTRWFKWLKRDTNKGEVPPDA